MDGQEAPTSRQTAGRDLANLFDKGVSVGALEECDALAAAILGQLGVRGEINRKTRSVLLEELLSTVVAEARTHAFAQREQLSLADAGNTATFQVAAAGELLRLTDEALFGELKDYRCGQFGFSWDQLLENRNRKNLKTERQLRAALWLGARSDKTAWRRQSDLRAALELAIKVHLDDEERREHFRVLVTEAPEPGNVPDMTVSIGGVPWLNGNAGLADVELRAIADKIGAEEWRRRREEMDYLGEAGPLLSVRWGKGPTQYVDHPANLVGETPGVSMRDSENYRIVDAYLSTQTGRFVILGRGGAGKTVLALQLVLDLLALRNSSSSAAVPVFLNLSKWDASFISLNDWLAGRVVEEFLDKPSFFVRKKKLFALADRLVAGGYILPVLDGFDEITVEQHVDAVRGLNRYGGRFVLTSRSREFYSAVDASHVLRRTAVVELQGLELDVVRDYLERGSRPLPDGTTRWAAIFDGLGESEDLPLLQALKTPLVAAMANSVYGSSNSLDPSELLDTGRFADPNDIAMGLLRRLVDVKYGEPVRSRRVKSRRSYDVTEATNWLGFLATFLHSRRTYEFSLPMLYGAVVGVRWLFSASLLTGSVSFLVFYASFGFLHVALIPIFVNLVVLCGGTSKATAFRDSRFVPVKRVRSRWLTLGFRRDLVQSFGMMLAMAPLMMLPGIIFEPAKFNLLQWKAIVFLVAIVGIIVTVSFNPVVKTGSWFGAYGLPSISKGGILGGLTCLALLSFHAGDAQSQDIFALLFAIVMGAFGACALSVWGSGMGYFVWLAFRSRFALMPSTFLEDACNRGLLRRVGGVYQFRHALLQDCLADGYTEKFIESGRSSRMILRARQSLSRVWCESGKFAEAEAVLCEIYPISAKKFGRNHFFLAAILCELASTRCEAGYFSEALAVGEIFLDPIPGPSQIKFGLPMLGLEGDAKLYIASRMRFEQLIDKATRSS